MNHQMGSARWHESANYRKLLSAMSKVRWLVSRGRHNRPDGALDVKSLMERLGDYVNEYPDEDYVPLLASVSKFVGMSAQELRYLADVGEWIEADRRSNDMDDAEYEQFWEGEGNAPNLTGRSLVPPLLSEEDMEEVRLLNQLFYG